MRNNSGKIVTSLFALFCLGIVTGCLFVFSNFLKSYIHARESSGWPQVPGIIRGIDNSPQPGRESGEQSIWYEYTIRGVTYRSSRQKFFEPDVVSEAQKGESVLVRYDPKNPKDACLYPGVSNNATISVYTILGVLLVVIFFASYSLYTAIFAKKSQSDIAEAVSKKAKSALEAEEWSKY